MKADARSKTYGDADPALTYTSHQTAPSPPATASPAPWSAPRARTRAATRSPRAPWTSSSNYALSFVGDELTINQRAITVTAGAQTKVYGDDDPDLSYKRHERQPRRG